jgi:signal transduction histidine kinase
MAESEIRAIREARGNAFSMSARQGTGWKIMRRPRLRTIFMIVNLLILLLPVGGIAILRLYESELIRRTQAELITQGATVAAFCRPEFQHAQNRLDPSVKEKTVEQNARSPLLPRRTTDLNELQPIPTELSLYQDRVYGRPPAARPASESPDPVAQAAGQRITPLLRSAASVTLAGIRVTDRHGVVVASTGGELGMSLAHLDEVRGALMGEAVSRLRERGLDRNPPPLASISRRGRVRVFVALPILIDGRVEGAVLLIRTPLDIMKALYLNRQPLLVGAAVLLTVVFLVSIFMSFFISRPIRALIQQSERASRGEKNAVVELSSPGTYEAALLSSAFARMARTLEERADYIRSFAAHVSHEFKTPLTSIRGGVELLRDHGDTMTPEERERFLVNLGEDADRLEHLVRRLLELARADVAKPGPESGDLIQVASQLVRRYQAEDFPVAIKSALPSAVVRMAPDLLESVLINLLDNARLHGGKSATVEIGTASDADSRIKIVIQDDGPGVSAANASRIFTPFFTTARERGGSGLGLSIVRSLLAAHGGGISLEPSKSGARFKLSVPGYTVPSS